MIRRKGKLKRVIGRREFFAVKREIQGVMRRLRRTRLGWETALKPF